MVIFVCFQKFSFRGLVSAGGKGFVSGSNYDFAAAALRNIMKTEVYLRFIPVFALGRSGMVGQMSFWQLVDRRILQLLAGWLACW